MTDQRRGIVWQDAQGEQVLHLINTTAGASGIQAALAAKSNASVVQESEGDLVIVDAAPTAATYPTVRTAAVLLFKDSRTNSVGRLYIPAPLPSIFFDDGDTVDPSQIAAIIAAAEGSLLAGSGNTVDMFTGGYLSKAVPGALPSTEGVMFVSPMTSTGDMIYADDSSGDAARLPIGTGGQILEVVGGVPTWSDPAGLAVTIPSSRGQGTGAGDYTTSSSAMVDIDSANIKVTVPAASGDILLITLTGSMAASLTGAIGVTFDVGGTVLGDTVGLQFSNSNSDLALCIAIQHVVTSGQISAGTVTIKGKFNSTSGTATIFNRTANVRPRIGVVNLRQ